MAIVAGWGRGTWGEGTWGSEIPVSVTGVSAAAEAGAVAFPKDVPVTGVSAATAAGSVSTVGEANV